MSQAIGMLLTMHRDERFLTVASRQRGLATSGQLRESGLSRRAIDLRCADGRLVQIRKGVFAVAGVPPSWEQSVLAAVLAAGEEAVASHFTAGALWGLPNIGREYLEVSTARPDQRRLRGVLTHRTTTFLTAEHTVRAGIAVTSVARTLLDCSGRLAVAQLGVATDDALRRNILRLEDLRLCAAGLRPAPGRHPKKIQAILVKRLPGYDPGESNLQMRFARGVVAHGCPEPVIEHRLRLGRKKYRVDLAYPAAMVAIEIDGWEWHHTRTAFDGDRARANDLVAAGWTVLRFTSSTTDAEAAAHVTATLVRLGAA
ncbi:MAG: type IV toxin-antitoxin system AbiEi family antitoxin domain-containing protein [Acidimicrobiia bacterium]